MAAGPASREGHVCLVQLLDVREVGVRQGCPCCDAPAGLISQHVTQEVQPYWVQCRHDLHPQEQLTEHCGRVVKVMPIRVLTLKPLMTWHV